MLELPSPAPYIKYGRPILNPIARFGIPKYADISVNPNVVETPDYQKWWEEQLYYFFNGYTHNGFTIPGRYYYYLNFGIFGKVGERVYPDVCDLHLELAHYIDYCVDEHKNFVCVKKRRAGVTEAFMRMKIDFGLRFETKYKAGISAGLDKHMKVFIKKWSEHNSTIVPEFRLKLVDNGEEKIAQYEVKEGTGFVKKGTFNTILSKTAHQNSGIFKGEELNDVVAEEGGEFDKLLEYYDDSNDCLMFGEQQVGNFWAWGTGGNMAGAGQKIEKMWHEYEDYNAVRFFIPATRFYAPYYGGSSLKGNVNEKTPNLQHLSEEERIGVEDIKAAEESILKRRDTLLKGRSIEKYIKYLQNNPLNIEEVFRRKVSSIFDQKILNDKIFETASQHPKYTKYLLKRKINDKGEFLTPLQVEIIPAKDADKEEDCVLIHDECHYIEGTVNLFCAGTDSYDLDDSQTSKSLGGMCVRIRDNDNPLLPKNKVAAVIRCRPKRKETFYDMCLLLSVYYNLNKANLIDVRNGVIFEYFKQNGGKRYLAQRPIKFESDNSEQVHEFGVSLNKSSKPKMVSLMQTDVYKNGHSIDFPVLLKELVVYDETTDGSDNDLADAYGMSLMQDIQMGSKPLSKDQIKDRNERFNLNNGVWQEQNGINPFYPTKDSGNFGR